MHGTRKRLLAIDVLAALHRRHRGHCMRMIGRGNEHRLNVLVHGIQHPSEVFEWFGIGSLLKNIAGSSLVHVTEGHDFPSAPGEIVEIAAALAADSDAGQFEFAICLVGKSQLASR